MFRTCTVIFRTCTVEFGLGFRVFRGLGILDLQDTWNAGLRLRPVRTDLGLRFEVSDLRD